MGVIKGVFWLMIAACLGMAATFWFFPVGPGLFERVVIPVILVGVTALMFVLFRFMLNIGGDSWVQKNGLAGTAALVQVQDTATTVNQMPLLRYILDVTHPDGSVYRAQVNHVTSRASLGALMPGLQLPVRIHPQQPNRVAIDTARLSQQAIPMPHAAGGTPVVPLAGQGAARVAGTVETADVVRDGIHTTATVTHAHDTGMTLGMASPQHAGTPRGDHPLMHIRFQVTGSDGRMFDAEGLHRVPPEQRHRIVEGALLRVAYMPADPANTTAVQWDRM